MARNGSGTYTKINTFTSGTTITASGHNSNWDDIATEMTNSVAADGQTTMTGVLKHASGTAAAPSVTFGSDTDTGLYRSSANSVGISLGGALAVEFSTSNAVFSIPVLLSATASFNNVATSNFIATATFGATVIMSATANFKGEIIASATAFFTSVLKASATAVFTTVPTAAGSPIVKQSDAAAQADQESASSTTKYVTPGTQKYHPGAAKAWVTFDNTGTIETSYGTTSVTKNSTGDYTITWSTAFSSTSYAVFGTSNADNAYVSVNARTTTTTQVRVRNDTSTVVNQGAAVLVFGDL